MFERALEKLKAEKKGNKLEKKKLLEDLKKQIQDTLAKPKDTIKKDEEERVTLPTLISDNKDEKQEEKPEMELSVIPKKMEYEIIEKRVNNMTVEEIEEIPLMKFEGNASAPILRYDIPSPSSYEGRSYIELRDLKINGKDLPFNKKANDPLTDDEFLEINRDIIFEYLTNSSKLDLERDFYLVFDLDDIKPAELLVQYPGTFSFEEGSLEGWEIYAPEGCIAEVVERKTNHTKVVLLQGTPHCYILNRFQQRDSGSIELWVEFTNAHPSEWANQIRLILGDKTDQGYLYSLRGGLYWFTKNAANENIVQKVATNITNRWIHLKMSWNGNKVYIFIDGVLKLSTTFFPGCNKVDGLWIGSWYNQEVWIDAVGYSWDTNYKTGDNLIEKEILVSREDSKGEILGAMKEIDPEVSNMLNAIKGEDESQLREKYQLFKYFIQAAMKAYQRMPVFLRAMSGKLKLKWVPIPKVEPRLILTESYKLTTFPGDYGAGTTIKTFSLLPKEETEISIKTWKKSISTIKEASSILDSYTEEKADEFENNVQNECSNTEKTEESNSYHAGVEGGVSWGAANVNASAGIEGGTSSARESFAKNVMNATSKHAQTASAKREVNIDTSFESTEETGEEVTIIRKIENLNAGRTLNFTFRQMNQQYHSLLHLTDVRIAFYNGLPGSMKEYSLFELGHLVQDYLSGEILEEEVSNEPESEPQAVTIEVPANPVLTREFVEEKLRDFILGEYQNVIDYNGTIQKFLEPVTITGLNGNIMQYIRVIPPIDREFEENGKKIKKKVGQQKYIIREEIKDESGNIIQPEDARFVDGIIIGKKVLTMRTDGIIVEALLGQGNALDQYSLASQREKIRERSLENKLREMNVKKINTGIKLINALISNNQLDKASTAFKEIFGLQEGLKYFGEIFNHPDMLLEKKI